MSKQTSKSSKSDKHDAISLLTQDHKVVQQMFKEFEQAKSDDDAKRELVDSVCRELMMHAQLEEEIFYPAARDALDGDGELVLEAEIEHGIAEQLIADLSVLDPDDEKYAATFSVLCEYVNHHIEEEEKQLFPKIKKAKLDLEDLGQQIEQRKQDLLEQGEPNPPESDLEGASIKA